MIIITLITPVGATGAIKGGGDSPMFNTVKSILPANLKNEQKNRKIKRPDGPPEGSTLPLEKFPFDLLCFLRR